MKKKKINCSSNFSSKDSKEKNSNDNSSIKEDTKISEIEDLKIKFSKEKDKFLRIFAEFENYKKRIQKERLDIFKIVNEKIVLDFIPILDDFERGINELKKYKEKNLMKGIFLIQEKLFNILKEKGLKKMITKKGDNFNIDLHEAITQIPSLKKELKGKIIEVTLNGYTLKDKVIRHAKVIIGK